MIGRDFLREAGVLECAEVAKFSEEFRGRGLLCSYGAPQRLSEDMLHEEHSVGTRVRGPVLFLSCPFLPFLLSHC